MHLCFICLILFSKYACIYLGKKTVLVIMFYRIFLNSKLSIYFVFIIIYGKLKIIIFKQIVFLGFKILFVLRWIVDKKIEFIEFIVEFHLKRGELYF